MAYRDSTTASGTSTTPAVAVPAGVAINDIVILVCGFDAVGASFAGKWPAGFTAFTDAQLTLDGHRVGVAWKRLTGADSGSYTLTALASSAEWVCQAFAFSGRHTTNPPVHSETLNNSSNATPVSVIAPTITAVDGDDILWLGVPDPNATGIGNGMAPPSTYTEAEDAELGFSYLSGAYKNAVAAGATGAITGTFTLTSGASAWAAYLLRLPVASSVVTLDQEGYRWRNDDGNETTATWKAAQDTAATLTPSTTARLRFIVNATGDPASKTFRLQYRKVGAAGWRNADKFV